MSTLLQSREIPHSPEEACLELWSMQDSLSSKCCPLTTLEIQKACDLLESTRTSASDSPFIGEESGQPNQGTTQSRGHTPPSHQRLWRDLWNFIHIVENLRLLTLSDTLVNEKNVIHLCLGVLLAVSTNIFNVYSQSGYILQKKLFLYTEISIRSDQISHSVWSDRSVSDSLQPHESQHARPPCPSQSLRVHSNSCPSCRWCHPAISSSVIPFSSCPQSLPASESFPMSQLFAEVAKVLEFQL